MPVAPQSIRTQSSHQYLFTLFGSTHVKAVCRTLMKLSPVVNPMKHDTFETTEKNSVDFKFSVKQFP